MIQDRKCERGILVVRAMEHLDIMSSVQQKVFQKEERDNRIDNYQTKNSLIVLVPSIF